MNRVLTKNNWAYVSVLILLAAAAGCGGEKIVEKEEVVQPAKIFTVASGDIHLSRSLPGRVRAAQRVDVTFKVSGPLITLPVEEGQEVRKNQVIARIDPRDFQTRVDQISSSIRESQARLEAMLVGDRPEDIRVLQAQVDAADAAFRNADQQYQRYRDLYIRKQVSKADFDRYKTERDIAQSRLEAARQQLGRGESGAREEDVAAMQASIQGLQAQLKAADDALADTYLRAPFSGVIARRYLDNFTNVQAKEPIVSLQDVSAIEILVDAPENLMANLKAADISRKQAEFGSNRGVYYDLVLKEFSTDADPVTQTYRIVLTMPAPEDIRVLPGMTATVLVEGKLPGEETGVFVPVQAVFADEQGLSYVWIVDAATMRVHRARVEIGRAVAANVRILSGLSGGEIIVTAGVDFLKENQQVRKLDTQIGG